MVFVLLLAGCGAERYTPVVSQETILITTNIKDGSLSFIEAKRGKLLATWHINKAVTGSVLLPDNDTLIVYGKRLNSMYVYSLKEGKRIGKWDTGEGIVNAMLTADKQHVILADQQSNQVRLYTVKGKETAAISVGKGPLTIVQGEGLVYTINFYDAVLSVVDIGQKREVRRFSIPPSSLGAALYNGQIWLGGHGSGESINSAVHVYDVKEGALTRSVDAPQMPISFAAHGDYIYVLSHGSSTLRKMNARTYQEEASVEAGANPFAVFYTAGRVFVASYDSDEVYQIDADTMKVQNVISVGKGPFHFTERKGERK
ncbi:MAG: YncE family protein [Ectobacillus sp.]